MQKPIILLLCLAVLGLIAGAFVLPELLSDTETPIMQWSADDEVEGSTTTEPETADPAEAATLERSEVEIAAGAVVDPTERIATILRGRVVDKYQQAVPGAKVWLEFGRSQRSQRGNRGDRQRRIPDPVITDDEGRFAFQGQAFRNLRVSLQVQHTTHALGMFDKDLGDTLAAVNGNVANGAEIELGDLVLLAGGEVRGRVTDLDGNGVAAAEVTLEPDMQNALRWVRDREQLLPPTKTDNNGFYTFRNIREGDFAVTALAPRHTEGRSSGFKVEEDKVIDAPDIQLGPGYDLTGFVRNRLGEPIANANVVVRSSRNQPNQAEQLNQTEPGQGRGGRQGGRGAFFGRGRDHRTRTDEKGRFFLDHLPGALLELNADAKGYLDYEQDGIDAKLGQILNITMQEGLRITGVAKDSNGSPVELFALRAVRLRDLPDPALANIDLNAVMAQLRDGNLDEATRDQLRRQMQSLRGNFGQGGRGGPGGPGGRGRGNNEDQGGPGRNGDLGEATRHTGGEFVADGLQEGVYELHLQATDYARYRSEEVEVRAGVAAPHVVVTLDAGVYVGGRVVDERGDPIANATVQLRSDNGLDFGAMRRGGRGQDGQQPAGQTPDIARMTTEFARMAQGANVNLEARTDRDGIFVLKHVPRGSFRLSAEHDGYADARTDAFELQADRSDFELRLGLLGSLFGKVSGFAANEAGEVRVGAVILAGDGNPMAMMGMFRGGGGRGGQGPFRTVDIDADGNYRIDDLVAGDYVVRAWVGSPQQLMRELGPSFFDGSLTADANVRGGDQTRFDLLLVRPMVGSVTGSVMHNGENAVGFQVELRAASNNDNGGNATPGGQGGRGGRGGRGFGGRSQQATVDADGRFTIKDVTAGTYELTIRSNGRRGAEMLKDTVVVLADAASERSYSVVTGSLRGTLTTDDGTDPKTLGGRVSLLPGVTEVPENLNGWLRQNTSYDGRITDGGFSIDAVPPGAYLLVLQARDRERTSQPVVVNGSENLTVTVGRATQGAGNQPR
ncbi:MAG: carboxypeptidase regulatory-like domain-containing protein [Planctomycetota bacterium]